MISSKLFNSLWKTGSVYQRTQSSLRLVVSPLASSPLSTIKKCSPITIQSSFFNNWCIKPSYNTGTEVCNAGVIRSAILNTRLSASPNCLENQTRSIIKWSRRRGRRKTDHDVIRRFKRLDWGIWIRPVAGADRQLWRKSSKRITRIKQNVFCNATQSRKLDKMVTNFWKRPRVYPDDPYKPYLKRENFGLCRFKPHEDF